MISRCPQTGQGVNDWVNRRVLHLIRFGLSDQQIFDIVSGETTGCGRSTTQDIRHSLETGRMFLCVADLTWYCSEGPNENSNS